ncbi:WYL domain-containing protein [Phytoactinopolyspora alkaliphila]|uniref:WYL domain-containing protein n=1 Tax=Phytoactinopolyspora alkaliphila TaxID=1783498 RepID=A0A6N9YIE5_9ACTN|nr:WYL domain-containing protein [Phytoactinopolyspora alkaliphila]
MLADIVPAGGRRVRTTGGSWSARSRTLVSTAGIGYGDRQSFGRWGDLLESALEALLATTLQGIGARRSDWLAGLVATVGDALRTRHRLALIYARAWEPGVREHVIEPYRLTKTRRGWELDAGLPDERVGTFLLSGIRSATLLDEMFDRPPDVDARIARNRDVTAVDVVVPQDDRWVVERFAESVEVIHEDEGEVRLRAHLLPPVEHRLGLLLVVAGPRAFVVTPTHLRDVGVDLARELLSHHADGADGR